MSLAPTQFGTPPPYFDYTFAGDSATYYYVPCLNSPSFSHLHTLEFIFKSSSLSFGLCLPGSLHTIQKIANLYWPHNLSLTLYPWLSLWVRCLSSLTWTISIALQCFPWIKSFTFFIHLSHCCQIFLNKIEIISSHLSVQRIPVTHHGCMTKGHSGIHILQHLALTPPLVISLFCLSVIASDYAITSYRHALAQMWFTWNDVFAAFLPHFHILFIFPTGNFTYSMSYHKIISSPTFSKQ